MMNEYKGFFYTIASGILFGFLGYFGTDIVKNNNFSVFNMLFWRFFIASGVLFLMIICTFKKIRFHFREMIYAFLGGSLFYSMSSFLYFKASKYIGTGLAITLFFSYPIIVSILNWFFYKQKITKFYCASFLLIAFGIILIVDISQITYNLYGVLFSVLSAIAYAIYIVSRQNRAANPLLSSLCVAIGSSITFLAIAIFQNSLLMPKSYHTWLSILGISIFCTALPIFMLLMGLKYINSNKVSIISVLEPVSTVIIGVLLLKERLNWFQIIGIFIILVGTLIIQLDKRPNIVPN